jgi:hypothetical protein
MTACTMRWMAGAALAACVVTATVRAQEPGADEPPRPGRASVAASNNLTLSPSSEVELAAVTLTKISDESAVLVLATVELVHAGIPTNKAVELSVYRGASRLDGAYVARIGTVNRAVSESPVTIHMLDEPPAGPHTYRLRARASHTGAEAAVRRLTAIEVP